MLRKIAILSLVLIVNALQTTNNSEQLDIDAPTDFEPDDFMNSLYSKHTRRLFGSENEAHMTTPQLIQKNEYPVEEHTVITKDGYVLTMHRIPHGKQSQSPGIPILLMHGIFATSSDFIIQGPKKSFAYYLADVGFDVWMGNARGNRYCRKHRTLSASSKAFWDFSFHEIAVFDMPALIDCILATTGHKQIYYAGHSQGATIFFILLSLHPEYNTKIIKGFMMSPVAYLKYMTSPLMKLFATYSNVWGLFLDVIGWGEFLPRSTVMSYFAQILCRGRTFTQAICTSPIYALVGMNIRNLDIDRLPVFLGHVPAGASMRQLIHYGQFYKTGYFQWFDYGVVGNLRHYGSATVPKYDITKVKVPTVLLCANHDWLANSRDVDILVRELPSNTRVQITDPNFVHIDFILGMNAMDVVYKPILNLIVNTTSPKPAGHTLIFPVMPNATIPILNFPVPGASIQQNIIQNSSNAAATNNMLYETIPQF